VTRRHVGGLAITENGEGPAVLWVHGYTLDSTVWEPLWQLLPGWHHVGVDLPGHGRSRPLAADERTDRLGRELADVARALGARHVVGLSFGSTFALQAAIEAPAAFDTVTLAAPAVAGGAVDPAAEVRYRQLGELYHLYGAGPHMSGLWLSAPPHIFTGARARPALAERIRALVNRHGWSELAGSAMQSLSAHVQTDGDLRRIDAKVLLLVGEHDMPAFLATAAHLARALPSARAVLVPGAGHLCILEEPETSALLLAQHLEEAEGPVSRRSS
jgi:pimeloyl-ACP methyl ester carboxylesterase